ncbi:MAG TPA: protein kinase, partial [Pseudomonadota bacterium]|nr:protein kinase [Pseudomonadota bacterium]
MAAVPSFRRGEVIARRYQVVTKSGETALWVGYHACDQGGTSHPQPENRESIPEPDVLVKVVKPDLVPEPAMREKLVRDLQRMRGLQHPGMPRLIDVQLLDEHNTVVLIEAIQAGLSQGVLLRRMVTFRQKERFPLAEVRQIGAQLASALSYIHGQMLCHGDLRLESVLLRPDGAKLCDIGLGAALPRSIYLEAVKKVGEVELLSPEVRAGRQPDPRADVFGLAALYRHLLSVGQGSGWEALLAEKPAMGHVLTRGMHEEPAQRYSSIEALIADIEAVALTGAPIRRRLAPTPLAMAVAAGRLPVEELSRPVEELVPESARSRRNSGIFEVGAVLAPLSGAPSAKMSIGTIPPQLSGQSSSRSGRLPDGSSADSNPSASSRDGTASATSKGPTSATSRGATSATSRGPTSATSRGPTSATSRGPASGISRDKPSGGSLPPPEAGEAVRASARSKEPEPGPVAPAAAKDALRDSTRDALKDAAKDPAKDAASSGASAPIPAVGVVTEAPAGKARAPRGAAPPGPAAEAAPKRVASEGAGKSTEATKPLPPELGSDDGRSARRGLSDSSSDNRDTGGKRPAADNGRGEGRVPASSRSAAPRGRGELSSQRSRSGDSVGKSSATTLSLPPNALITSRLALVGALVLAALVGALVAVVVMLLLRPASLLPAAPPPQLTAPAGSPKRLPTGPSVPVPVVPLDEAPKNPPAGELPGAPAPSATEPGSAAAPAAPAAGPAGAISPAAG